MFGKCLVTLLLFVTPASALAEDALATSDLGARFCRLVQEGEQSIELDALISASLAAAISEALARNDAIQAGAPDEKPPLGDGIPWMSWPDRPDTCNVNVAVAVDKGAALPISYGFTAAPEASYTDTLVLVHEAGAWRIDDVILLDDQHLRSVIETAFEP